MRYPVFLFATIFNVILLIASRGYLPPYEQIGVRNSDSRAAVSTNVSMADATPSPQIQEITITPVKAVRANPSRTPKPTPIPPEIPPPTDRRLLHSMILFSVLAVVVVIFGVWINRDRFNMR